ncbi:DNA mismatch repair protein MSH7 [Amborella trichopoda]|uniref:DNA mismatch repair protein MSH7 n=1 Tax=Amborella trichopoda TaxID=13333 RepID=UPI0009C11D9A|nr:DNA mismatch repair protein MSH7 [Amborella trichopoda]|eukprot:XP_020521545.1 DNA mismatch repair protein MSH7 [Amborella trichopoda]
MHRQKSIDSFFSKPSPGNENSGGSTYAEMLIRRRKMQFSTNRVKQTSAVAEVSRVSNARELPFVETKGTDTPPEKLHARPVNLSVNGKSDSMPFGNLMQKFVVEGEPEVDGKGKQMGKGTVSSNPKLQPTFDDDIGLSKQRTPFRPPLKIGATNLCASIKNGGSQTTETYPEGIETPPEKLQARPRSSRFFKKEESNSVSFESLMGKFVVEDEPEGDEKRKQCQQGTTCSNLKLEPTFDKDAGFRNLTNPFRPLLKNDAVEFSAGLENGGSQSIETVREVSGPETPAMRPLVPRLKRIQEEQCNFNDMLRDSLTFGLNKKQKMVNDLDLGPGIGSYCGASENIGSKFEWLNPSSIRDSNKRRPGDPLYDKRTLYIPPDALNKMSASQRQYWTVKSQYMDVVLFFKVGKFYELYELDAEIGHKELDWKMTFSGVGKCRQVGISESGIDDAVQKLIARGHKVARMEQTETADQAKARGGASAVIKRKLVHVFTPSTTSDGNIGPHAIHLLALKEGCSGRHGGSSPVYGFAFLDCAALKFWVGSLRDEASSSSALGALLMHVSPKEVLYENGGLSKQTQQALKRFASTGSTSLLLSPVVPGAEFAGASEVEKLIQSKHYFEGSCNPWTSAFDGIKHPELAISALGGLVCHLSRLMLDDVLRNGDVAPYDIYARCLQMDGQTLVNLELFNNNADGGKAGTLLNYLDSCITPSGKRLLRNWICHPLQNIEEINNRLNLVENLMKHVDMNVLITQHLRKLPDLERLMGRVKSSVGSSDVLSLPLVGKKVLKQHVKAFGSLIKGLRIGMDMLKVLQKEEYWCSQLANFLPPSFLNGIKNLDVLLTELEAAFDDDFPHYQDHNIKDSDAETLSVLVNLFIGSSTQWSQAINCLSTIDVLQSFAVTANSCNGSMCRPVFMPPSSSSGDENKGSMLKINGVWHPYAIGVNGSSVVPNDVYLGGEMAGCNPNTLLLTGPNMGGKSTLLRATCLAVILAQLGCYVPCESCVLSPVDIIFTRLGSTDRIMLGESTFLIECSETASILQHATQNSLVVLDELGRGTSTFDGYAIAYAVFRHLIERVHCRLLFATHYHFLTKEFASHPHVSLQHMACIFEPKDEVTDDKQLVFLYKLASGACPGSYGTQVALMAGIPNNVVKRASNASLLMKSKIGDSFAMSEKRAEFSTLHEEWLKELLGASGMRMSGFSEDGFDTLICLWHELKSFYQGSERK